MGKYSMGKYSMGKYSMTKYLGIAVALCAAVVLNAQLKNLKPGFNLFTPDQDVQLGKEAQAEVEKTKPVLHNARLDSYMNGLAQRLAASPRTGKFPFTFEIVSDGSINAFALPGGPVFVHTATIAAAQNEAQLAGVLAHEMSHVALRHGTHEASKAQALQAVAGLAGSAAGTGMLGQLTKMGIGLGANSMLLHYSRDAEAQADYNGAQVMGEAGYDPREMARFFQLLETKGSDGRLAQFLSDHPTPGNRVASVEKEVAYMPVKTYQTDSPEFQQMRALVRSFPPPPPPAPIPPAAPAAH